MSTDDFWTISLSNAKIKEYARKTREFYGLGRTRPVNIVRCIESGSVLTVRGRKALTYKVIPDHEMSETDAKTELIDDVVIITARASVDLKARCGDGRSRMTLSHELAHAVLHPGAARFRRVGAQGRADSGRVLPYNSAEHQAKVFAVAFLVQDEQLTDMKSADEISEQFGISYDSAKIIFNDLLDKNNKSENVKLVTRLADEFRKSTQSLEQSTSKYISDYCSCGAQKLIPIGIKYLCDECGRIGDRFQDGDQQI